MKHAFVFSLLAVSLVFGPRTVQAQDVTVAKTPPGVTVSVDYVDVAAAGLDQASRLVPPGDDHDLRLRQALVAAGATDTPGPRLSTVDKIQGRVAVNQQVPYTVRVKGKSEKRFLDVTTFTEATPELIQSGAIRVKLNLQKSELVPGSDPPMAATQRLATDHTFRDGQTLLMGGLVRRTSAAATVEHLIFVTVASASSSTPK